MKNSNVMDEIRTIRNANSLKRLSQSPVEREQEIKKSMEWFISALGKPVIIIPCKNHLLPTPQ